jgi:hypothetical protein
MKPLVYTGSRERYTMPLFVPGKEIFDTSFRSWESFTLFLKKQKKTKIVRSDPIIVQELDALIHSNVPDYRNRLTYLLYSQMENSAVQKSLNHESSLAWFILLVSVQQVIPATLRVLVLTGWLSKTRITSWIGTSITRNEPDLSREKLFREHLSKTN